SRRSRPALSQKRSPAEAGLRYARSKRSTARGIRARAAAGGVARAARRGRFAGRHFTVAEHLDLDAPVGGEAGDELLVGPALGSHAAALGLRLALAHGLDLDALRIDALLD